MSYRALTRTVVPAVVVTGVVAVGFGAGSATEPPPAPPLLAPAPATGPPVVAAAPPGLVRVDLTWSRQSGHASNQLAVWVEDAAGRHVRSLFATSFTAEGGYDRRPMSLPAWRAAAGWDDPPSARVEAVSRPSPDSGPLSLYWDGLDEAGTPLAPGVYRVRVEANLRWENRVLYAAEVEVGGTGATAAPEPEFDPAPVPESALVADVQVRFLPGERLDPAQVSTYTRGS